MQPDLTAHVCRTHLAAVLRRLVEGGNPAYRPNGATRLSEPLVTAMSDYLANHPNRSDPEAALWPGRAPGNGHPTTYARRFDHLSFYRWYFKPAVKRAGLPHLRFHDLRHTYASLMFAAGMDVYKVSRWMGHANISTTDSIYAHLYPQDHSADSERFAAFLATPDPIVSAAPTPLRQAKQGS